MLIVHDSHTKPDVEKPVDVLRWQGRKMGLLEVGYHLVIDREGFIHYIRDVLSMGSHCPAYNHVSIGVCLIGGLDADGEHVNNFTLMQTGSLHMIVGCFQRQWVNGKVLGHNELRGYREGPSKCPSIDMNLVRSWVSDIHGPTLSEMMERTRGQ